MRKLKLLMAACALMVGYMTANAQASYNKDYKAGVAVAAGGDYFLYNIGAKQFLTSGLNYGTRATVDNSGRVLTLSANGEGYNIYTNFVSLNNRDENTRKAGYLTTNGFVDTGSSDAAWVFTSVSVDGYTNAYTIKNSETQYLFYDEANTDPGSPVNVGNNTGNNYSYWLLIPKANREAVGDYTHYLINTQMNAAWEYKTWGGSTAWDDAAVLTIGGNVKNRCGEKFHTVKDISQEIKATLPNGKYKLYAQAFYRQDKDKDNNVISETAPDLYLNSDKKAIGAMKGSENSMTDASASFSSGSYVNDVTTHVTDGKLKGGINITASYQWVAFDNFYLEYLGPTLSDAAIALPEGGAMAADTWYVFEPAEAGIFNITATTIDDIIFATDGEMLTSEANSSTQKFNAISGLQKIKYYVKSSSANQLTVGTKIFNNDYFCYLRTADYKYLSRGANYNTQAIADNYGVPVRLSANAKAGIELIFIDNWFHLFDADNGNLFTDNNHDVDFALEAAEGGYYVVNKNATTHSTFGGKMYINTGDGNRVKMSKTDATVWIFEDANSTAHKTQMQAVKDAQSAGVATTASATFAGLSGITTKAAFDSYVSENLIANDIVITGTGGTIKESYQKGGGSGSGGGALEIFKETVDGLTPGLYKLSVKAFERITWAGDVYNAGGAPGLTYVYANDEKVQLWSLFDYPSTVNWADNSLTYGEKYYANGTDGAQAAFDAGNYVNDVYVWVADDGEGTGHITFGINKPHRYSNDGSRGAWICYNNFSLKLITEPAGIPVTGITLSPTSPALTTGDVLDLTATITPEEADDKSITWSSSDNTIATVANGKVTALKAGTVVITATANGGDDVDATCTITIADAPAAAHYSELADGDFYIRNVATGKYLGGSNSWGTQASLIKHGIPFGFTKKSEGVYTLDSYTYNKELEHFFNGTYIDGGSADIYVTSLGSGKYALSTADGSAFVTAKAGTTVVDNTAANSNSTFAQWQLISANDRLQDLTDATSENLGDATFYIQEANISRNLRKSYNNSAWNGVFSYGGNNENQCAESINKTHDVYQTASVPNGTYIVKAQGFYRPGKSAVASYLYANDQQVALKLYNAETLPSESMAGASTAFSADRFWNQVEVTVTDNKLTIGIKTDATDSWTIWDNFELYLKTATGLNVTPELADGEYSLMSNGKLVNRRGTGDANQAMAAEDGLKVIVKTDIAGISTITMKDTGLRLFWNEEFVYTDGTLHVKKAKHHPFWAIEKSGDAFKLRNIETGLYLNTTTEEYGTAVICADEGADLAFVKTITITSAGYATYCSENALDFSGTGIKAYTATVSSKTVTFHEVEGGKIAGNNGLLLKGEEGIYQVPVTVSTNNPSNDLAGVLEDTSLGAGIFVLMNGAKGVGFYKTTTTFTVGAHTAYLPASAGSRMFIGFDDEEEVTGIRELNSSANKGAIYNMNGVRVEKAKKGLYIQNGKKFVVK